MMNKSLPNRKLMEKRLQEKSLKTHHAIMYEFSNIYFFPPMYFDGKEMLVFRKDKFQFDATKKVYHKNYSCALNYFVLLNSCSVT